MKCCASLITSTGSNRVLPRVSVAAQSPSIDAPNQLSAQSVVQALLFSEILKPLGAALGPLGDAAIGSVVQQTFVAPRR